MRIFAHSSSCAQNGIHIDHCAFTDLCADIDDSAHHNDSVFADFHTVTNGTAGFNTRFNVCDIQHRYCGVSSVIFCVAVLNFVCVCGKNLLHQMIVAHKKPEVICTKQLYAFRNDRSGKITFNHHFHRGRFFCVFDKFRNFIRIGHIVIHWNSSFKNRFALIIYQMTWLSKMFVK